MINLLFGHVIGDYFLQPYWMATQKTDQSYHGWVTCLCHSLIYAVTMVFCLNFWQADFFVLLAMSHYIIDRFSLGNWWLKLIDGRPLNENNQGYETAFSAIVYTVVDNAIHLILAYLLITTFRK